MKILMYLHLELFIVFTFFGESTGGRGHRVTEPPANYWPTDYDRWYGNNNPAGRNYPQTNIQSRFNEEHWKNDQCPCTRPNGSSNCFEYDLRRQAFTFEEAVIYFPDILFDGPDSLKPLSGRTPIPVWCHNDSWCKDCANALMTNLHKKGYISEEELQKERQKFGYNATNIDDSNLADCWNLKFSKNRHIKQPYNNRWPNGGGQPFPHPEPGPTWEQYPQQASPWNNQNVNQNRRNATQAVTNDTVINTLIQQGKIYYETVIRQNRGKRQIQTSQTNQSTANLGQVYQIDCINRGEAIDPDGLWVSLCNICWIWRKLPNIYFPTYLNEFVCSTDIKCLSGFGECKQRVRPVDVMQNFGTESVPLWRPITLSSSTFCECEARYGSAFHQLVSA